MQLNFICQQIEQGKLSSVDLNKFAISGHTEGKKFLPWQIFDKSRYQLVKKI